MGAASAAPFTAPFTERLSGFPLARRAPNSRPRRRDAPRCESPSLLSCVSTITGALPNRYRRRASCPELSRGPRVAEFANPYDGRERIRACSPVGRCVAGTEQWGSGRSASHRCGCSGINPLDRLLSLHVLAGPVCAPAGTVEIVRRTAAGSGTGKLPLFGNHERGSRCPIFKVSHDSREVAHSASFKQERSDVRSGEPERKFPGC